MRSSWIALMALLVSCGGPQPDGADADGPPEVVLPPMSVGTIQGIGPHVYTSSLKFESAAPGDDSVNVERVELIWLDLEHYRLTRWKGGTLAEDEYRDGDLLVFRRGKGAFRWGQPGPGANYLLATITPFDTALVEFAADLQVVEESPRHGDPDDYRRFTLSLRPTDLGADADKNRLEKGHSSVPIALAGVVVVDGTANRMDVQLEGSYRAKNQGKFDEQPTQLIFYETRSMQPGGVDLLPPPEAMVMLLERKQKRQVDTSKTAPIP